MPLCLDSDANENCRNGRGSSIRTDINRSATDWWCKPSPCSLPCDIWLVTPRGVKLITLWLAWPLLRNELNWRMTPAWARLAARWPNCGQRADHPNPVGMWPWPCHTLADNTINRSIQAEKTVEEFTALTWRMSRRRDQGEMGKERIYTRGREVVCHVYLNKWSRFDTWTKKKKTTLKQ